MIWFVGFVVGIWVLRLKWLRLVVVGNVIICGIILCTGAMSLMVICVMWCMFIIKGIVRLLGFVIVICWLIVICMRFCISLLRGCFKVSGNGWLLGLLVDWRC